jgi:hypothetical protein
VVDGVLLRVCQRDALGGRAHVRLGTSRAVPAVAMR